MTCSFAVRGALKKFAEVQNAEVSLNRGIAAVTLKPGNKVKVTEFWDVVTRNGFTTKETKAVLKGEILPGGQKMKVSGSGEVYFLKGTPPAIPPGQMTTFEVLLKAEAKEIQAQITSSR